MKHTDIFRYRYFRTHERVPYNVTSSRAFIIVNVWNIDTISQRIIILMWFSFWFNSTFTFSFKFTLRSFLQLFSLFVLHNDQKTNILQMNGKKKFARILLYKISNTLTKRMVMVPWKRRSLVRVLYPVNSVVFLPFWYRSRRYRFRMT